MAGAFVNPSESEKRPREKTKSKVDAKHDASTLALQETLRGLMTEKEAREERKRQEKEEQMKTYFDIQKKKLEIEQDNAAGCRQARTTSSLPPALMHPWPESQARDARPPCPR